MKVLRVTVVRPKRGQQATVASELNDLAAFLSRQKGFIEGYQLKEGDLLGRITVWEDKDSADHAASTDHVMAVRARLHRACQDEPEERLFEVTGELTATQQKAKAP